MIPLELLLNHDLQYLPLDDVRFCSEHVDFVEVVKQGQMLTVEEGND